VNDLVAALGDITSDPGLHTFSLEELDEFAVIGSRPVTEGFDVRPTLYPLNWRIRVPRTALSEDEKQRASIYLAVSWQGHPFMAYPRLARAARRAREAGDYSQAAILASASGEILLNLLLRAMLVEEGAPDDLERLFGDDRGGFSARLRRDYGPRLGGTWDVDDPTNEVGHWVHGAQKLRNRVVHAGYSPTGGEASEALHGGEVLESFVFERLIDRRYKYPKTALSIFGEPGLRRRGLWNQRMRRVADELLVGLPEFWASVVGEPASPKADAR
jgi:hypothetical protein